MSEEIPRILYVTEFWPAGSGNGAELRSRQVLEALEQIGSVEVIVLDEDDQQDSSRSSSSDLGGRVTAYPLKRITRPGFAGKARGILSRTAAYPHGCGVSGQAEEQIVEKAHSCDLIWFFKLRAANMFGKQVWSKSVVDIDDIPSTYLKTESIRERALTRKLAQALRTWAWKRRERLLGSRFSVLSVCSEADRKYLQDLGANAPIHVIPNGFQKPSEDIRPTPVSPPRIGFIGFMDYVANLDGIEWFVKECWPEVRKKVPEARLRIVGRGGDRLKVAPDAGVEVLGWVADPSEEIASWSAMVVPIRIGAGTRVKIADGFSRRCPVIATPLGVHGYAVANGRELLIAETAEAFAAACVSVIENGNLAQDLAERAWRAFAQNWTWEAITPRIWNAASQCIGRTVAAPDAKQATTV